MRFDVPAGNRLVFDGADGAPLATPELVPLTRSIEIPADVARLS